MNNNNIPVPKFELGCMYRFTLTFSIYCFYNFTDIMNSRTRRGLEFEGKGFNMRVDYSENNKQNSSFLPINSFNEYFNNDKNYNLIYVCYHIDSGLYFRFSSASTLYKNFDKNIRKIE
jgi:hypothetical protein